MLMIIWENRNAFSLILSEQYITEHLYEIACGESNIEKVFFLRKNLENSFSWSLENVKAETT